MNRFPRGERPNKKSSPRHILLKSPTKYGPEKGAISGFPRPAVKLQDTGASCPRSVCSTAPFRQSRTAPSAAELAIRPLAVPATARTSTSCSKTAVCSSVNAEDVLFGWQSGRTSWHQATKIVRQTTSMPCCPLSQCLGHLRASFDSHCSPLSQKLNQAKVRDPILPAK